MRLRISVYEVNPGQELKKNQRQELLRNAVYWLASLLSKLSYTTWNDLPKSGIIHSELQ